MNRRSALASLVGLAAAGCGGVRADLVSFDRGEFALMYADLYTFGQSLLSRAIAKNTSGGQLNAYAQGLQKFSERLATVDEKVRKAIVEAPQKAAEAHQIGLEEVTGILSKALPLILPLITAAL